LAIDVRHLLWLKIAESLLNILERTTPCSVIDLAITVGVVIVGFAKGFVDKVISYYMTRLDLQKLTLGEGGAFGIWSIAVMYILEEWV
jgi:hypothetical protein